MHVIEDLDGTNVARGQADADTCQITIMAPASLGDDGYVPAASLTISGLSAIADLHDLCDRLIEAHAEANQAEANQAGDQS